MDIKTPIQENLDSKQQPIFEPFYHAVSAYSLGKDDWEIVAIFTKEADAQSHLAWIEAGVSASHLTAGCVEHLPMTTIIDLLVDQRLGKVGEAIKHLSSELVALVREKLK